MITGDNPLTAKAITEQAGLDDYVAQATPEAKLNYINQEQAKGKLVAMVGDGTSMTTRARSGGRWGRHELGYAGRQGGRQHCGSGEYPTKIIEVVEMGKQLLMTRGALTTFSLANDLAKYFAIVPAMFAAELPG